MSGADARCHIFVWLQCNVRAAVDLPVATFEWDPAKDAVNRRKHGVSFADAQLAFLDPHRVIARDVVHSVTEERHYCIGSVGQRIMTVRFTWRGTGPSAHRGRILASGQGTV